MIFRPIQTGFVLLALPLLAAAQTPVAVEAATERPVVDVVTVTGTVTSPRNAVLSTAVGGLVDDIRVDQGARVERGEALLRLDAELAAIAVDRANADLRRAEATLADARRRLEEGERVGPERGIARTEIESRRAEVRIGEAAVAVARANAREQEALLARHTLTAPFDGVVSERSAELGEWVNPGDGLFELVATDKLRFDFRISQQYFGALTTATPIEIFPDATPGEGIPGHIAAIVPVKSPGARTFLVRAIADPDAASAGVTPGMSVRGQLRLETGRQGVVVSRDAILRYPDGRIMVWVVDQTGEAPAVREQRVRIGLAFDRYVEIRDGVSVGDIVVTRGNETLQQGQSVRIVEEAR